MLVGGEFHPVLCVHCVHSLHMGFDKVFGRDRSSVKLALNKYIRVMKTRIHEPQLHKLMTCDYFLTRLPLPHLNH